MPMIRKNSDGMELSLQFAFDSFVKVRSLWSKVDCVYSYQCLYALICLEAPCINFIYLIVLLK